VPLPQRLPNPRTDPVTLDDVCAIADRWGLHGLLVDKLIRAQQELPFDLWIFSGARTAERQEAVSSTPFALSTHADTDADGCPRKATGADVQPVSSAVRASGAAVAQMGAE